MDQQERSPTSKGLDVHPQSYQAIPQQEKHRNGFILKKNGYFHLDIKCLQMHDSTIEMRQVTITDENFLRLSQQQLEFLSAEGILEQMVANKEKTL